MCYRRSNREPALIYRSFDKAERKTWVKRPELWKNNQPCILHQVDVPVALSVEQFLTCRGKRVESVRQRFIVSAELNCMDIESLGRAWTEKMRIFDEAVVMSKESVLVDHLTDHKAKKKRSFSQG